MVHTNPEYIGPYRVIRLLGRGGMGNVYEGVHETTKERVAVKMIAEDLAREPRFHGRFEAEVQTLIRLKHPNIVRIIGIGDFDSIPFYSMEFIEGINLHQKLKLERKLDWHLVLDWAIDISSALKQAHDFGIIHRDLKPANLMVTKENKIKLLDFGISRLYGSDNETVAGSAVGTADFMPPEQAEGGVATPRSDLYALGAICYACLSGRAPFSGNSVPEILFNVRYGVYTPLSQLADSVPADFCNLVDELLSREPNKRPATAYLTMNRLQAMRAALNRLESQRSHTKVEEDIAGDSNSDITEEATSVDLSDLKSAADLANSPYHDATRFDPAIGKKDRPEIDSNTTPDIPLVTHGPQKRKASAFEDATQEHVTGKSSVMHPTSEGMSTSRGSNYSEVTDRDRARATIFESTDPVIKERERWTEISLITSALIACLGAFYYFSRPVDPSKLFDPIHNAMASGDESRLLELEDQINAFQEKYPADERIGQIQAAAQEVDYLKRLRHLQRSQKTGYQGQEAIVSALRQIVRNKESDFAQSKARLAAFLDAYPENLLSKEEMAWMRFARRLQGEFEAKQDPEFEKRKSSQLESLYNRILATELPVDRQRALQGLIEVYGKEVWAEPILTKATSELKKMMPVGQE
jgi:serine/threonine-protein kinase